MRNFKDLDYIGLKTGKLLRSDLPYKLTFKDKRMLKKEHDLRLIIDLRRPEECKKRKDSWMFLVKHINLPLISDKKTIEVKGLTLGDMEYYYRCMVHKEKKEIWTKIFELFLESKHGILFHCSAGKDRTGVVAAIAEYALGFDKEAIYKDYLLTNENPLYYKVIAEKYQGEQKEAFLANYAARKEYLDATFDEIDKLYGSVDNFLTEICNLNEEKIKRLRENYLNI